MKKVLCVALALAMMLSMSIMGFCAELTSENPTGSMQITTEVPAEHKITISYSEGGYVLLGGKLCPSGTEITIGRFGEIDLDVICKKGYHVNKIEINGEDVTEQFVNGSLKIENVVDDIYVEFAFGECAKDPDDDCVKIDMEGGVYLGDKKLDNADMYFDFGSFTAATDENGRYSVEDIADGRHVVSFSKDGKKLGTCEFVITLSDDVDEVQIVELSDGTQSVIVPRGTDKIYLNFVIADENGDGIPDVDPDETDPSIPPEGGFTVPDGDGDGNGNGDGNGSGSKKDNGVKITLGEPEEKKPVQIPEIPKTFGEFMHSPYLFVSVMAVSMFFILLLVFKRKKEDEDEQPTA